MLFWITSLHSYFTLAILYLPRFPMKITWSKILYLYVKIAYLCSLKKKKFPKKFNLFILKKWLSIKLQLRPRWPRWLILYQFVYRKVASKKSEGLPITIPLFYTCDKTDIINDSPSSLERNVCRMETDKFNFDGRTKPFVPLFSPFSLPHYWPLFNLCSSCDDPIVFGIDRKIGRLTKRA